MIKIFCSTLGKEEHYVATKDIRDKYVLSRLLWDIGLLDDFVSDIDFS